MGRPNVNDDTTYAYLVNLSTKGRGVKNSQNFVNVAYGCPLIEILDKTLPCRKVWIVMLCVNFKFGSVHA